MASIWLAGTLIHPQQIPICRTFGSGRRVRSGRLCPWRRLSPTMELARGALAGLLAGVLLANRASPVAAEVTRAAPSRCTTGGSHGRKREENRGRGNGPTAHRLER